MFRGEAINALARKSELIQVEGMKMQRKTKNNINRRSKKGRVN